MFLCFFWNCCLYIICWERLRTTLKDEMTVQLKGEESFFKLTYRPGIQARYTRTFSQGLPWSERDGEKKRDPGYEVSHNRDKLEPKMVIIHDVCWHRKIYQKHGDCSTKSLSEIPKVFLLYWSKQRPPSLSPHASRARKSPSSLPFVPSAPLK